MIFKLNMENNVIQSGEIIRYRKFLGNKTLNLKRGVDFGFCVPEFVALPATISKRLFLDKKFRDQVVNEIIKNTQYKSYAVRSSALIEDGKNESLAGKFLTKINITKNKLEYAVYEVLKQAEARGDLKKFSVIIQKYILPNISGVKFKKIEKEYEFPQESEWCIRDNKFYLLQTRPISTISDKQYEQIIFLEKNFSQKEKYYFAKTEVSETSPRPTNFTFDILRSIYMENGPVDRVYKKYGIDYQNTDFLKIIGNELYVDKEKEIISLLPAYTYFKNKYFLPRFSRFSRSLATIKNLFFLNMIRGVNHKILFNKLKIKIEDNQSITDLRTAIKNFLIDYELVFEINLLSGISIKRLESMIKKEPFSFLKIIGSNSIFSVSDKYNMQIPAGLKGNSLDMIDESEFVAAYNDEKKEDRELIVWWNSVPDYKKYFLKDKIKGVVIFHRLRELGRWLTVKNINIIRRILLVLAEKNKFQNKRDIYFSSMKDVLQDKINEETFVGRREDYKKYNHFIFPKTITSSIVAGKFETCGVSSGLAEGVLWTSEKIEKEKEGDKKAILYTEVLSPDLARYFNRIGGILSNNGSLLSHLAILARERSIPVVVGFSLDKSAVKIGDKIRMDGDTGEITKL